MDWGRMSLCIKALSEQTYPSNLFEVIIVNNNPEDQTPDNYWLPENQKIITEEKPGSYAARNAALKIAKGDIIGFTDSDCIPDKNWITNAVNYLNSHKDCSRVAGRIPIIYKSGQPTVVELYNEVYAFPQKWQVQQVGTSVTANLFTYKHVFEKVGTFDDTLMTMGDSEWARKAHLAGFKIDYVENVVVHHPARTFAELVKKEKRLGGGDGILRKKSRIGAINFIKFLNSLRPRIKEIKFMNVQGSDLNIKDRVKLLFIRHYLLSIRDFEKFRVQMGKAPNRE